MLFIGMAFLSLLIEFWKDITTLEVDERRAWFMQGAGIALSLNAGVGIAYIIAGIITVIINITIAKYELKKKKTIFADGDKDILRWLIPGTFALFPWYCITFLFLLLPSIFLVNRLGAYHGEKNTPGLIPILAAFIMTGTLVLKGLLIL